MLEIKNLKTGYGDVVVLHDISIRVSPGEVVSLIGYNGAGKSTLVNTICGLVRPMEGEILVDGKDCTELTPRQIVELGVSQVPEGRKLFVNMTVHENLEMGGLLIKDKTEKEKRINEMYELFPILSERRRQLAGTLSGGEQQMLAIGRGLIPKPKYLILDEPSLGVAPIVVKDIIETIKRIASTGTGVLLVEQNLVQALEISDYSFILEDRVIAKEGRAEDLLKDEETKKAYLGI